MRRPAALVLALFVAIAALAVARQGRADPLRILVAASSSTGAGGDRPLAHARDDASGVRDVLASLGGVASSNAIIAADATRASLVAAFGRAQAMARTHRADEVTFFFYFSGHGDRDALHLAGETLPVSDLASLVSSVPAALRVVVVDACRTTDGRAKGMSSEPGFAVTMSSDASTTGSAWLYASGDGEAALESDEIGGAIFTHFWIAGLRGAADVNGDRRITLDESFAYAYAQTLLRSARSGGVLQRPQAKVALTEASPVVVTQLTTAQAQLELPREADVLYLVYAKRSQTVVAEVYGAGDRNVRLALPAGRYLVQRRDGSRGAAAEIDLAGGQTRALDAHDFRAFPSEALALKGSMIVAPWSVAASAFAFGAFGAREGRGAEAALMIGWRGEAWGVALGPVASLGDAHTPANGVAERALGGELSIERFVALSDASTLRLGVDARGEWVGQRVTRNDADRVAAVGLPTTSRYSGSLWGGGAHAALRYSIGTAFFVDGAVRGLALGATTTAGAEGRMLVGAGVGVGATF